MDKNTLHSSFGKWVSPINVQKLTEQVNEIGQDRYTKKLSTEMYIKIMLFAQLHEFESLEEMSDALIDEELQRTLGFDSISASQLSRKNREINPYLLSNLFLDLVWKIQRYHRQTNVQMPLKIIDSSTLPLNLNNHQWAEFRKTKAGVKLHLRLVFMDKGAVYPEKAVITTAKEHDRNQLEVLVDDKEAMYVFDRGYVDYEFFDRMMDDGYFFLSRLKKNAVTHVVHSFALPDDEESILSDKMVYLGNEQNRTENVFRLIEVMDEKGKVLRLIMDRFDISAQEISEMYRCRWAIELFFKWLKQHVEIKHFYGMTEKAIQNQVYLVLITYCLHVLIQLETKSKKTLLRISRWLKRSIWKPSYVWIRKFDGRASP